MIFDLDGTLIDSEPVASRALLELLPDLSGGIGELAARYQGQKLANVLSDVERHLNRSLPANFETVYRERVSALFKTELKPMVGAAAMLAKLPLPRGVASSAPMAKIRQALALTGLAPFIGDALYSSHDIGSWKPEPDLFLHAADKLGFAPATCMVVEDSIVGITAGLAAGMNVVCYDPLGRSEVSDEVTTIRDLRDIVSMISTSDDRQARC